MFLLVTIEIPEDSLRGFALDESRARIDLAVGLYTDGCSLGRAADVARMTHLDFRRELSRRRISLRYEVEDLKADLETLSSLRGE